ncbi:hypothetical protein KY362_01060 [Candidatus Woesearchaeota archaeon]|nr:hypothetical protein [Candidatus Woesearchaeota archaeon]
MKKILMLIGIVLVVGFIFVNIVIGLILLGALILFFIILGRASTVKNAIHGAAKLPEVEKEMDLMLQKDQRLLNQIRISKPQDVKSIQNAELHVEQKIAKIEKLCTTTFDLEAHKKLVIAKHLIELVTFVADHYLASNLNTEAVKKLVEKSAKIKGQLVWLRLLSMSSIMAGFRAQLEKELVLIGEKPETDETKVMKASLEKGLEVCRNIDELYMRETQMQEGAERVFEEFLEKVKNPGSGIMTSNEAPAELLKKMRVYLQSYYTNSYEEVKQVAALLKDEHIKQHAEKKLLKRKKKAIKQNAPVQVAVKPAA